MKKHFLTFGDSWNYRKALVRIEAEVAAMDFFDSYTISNETKIPEFIDFHQEFFSGNKTGFGFWIWKPYLVGQALEAMADGDILLYCDSGCQFNVNERSLKRLQEYFDMLAASEHATLVFRAYPQGTRLDEEGLLQAAWRAGRRQLPTRRRHFPYQEMPGCRAT